jgi:hypothetical protein
VVTLAFKKPENLASKCQRAIFVSSGLPHPTQQILTINIPVVYMGRDVWIWMGGNPQRGPFEGVGPEMETFLDPEMATSEASAIRAQKSLDFSAFYS